MGHDAASSPVLSMMSISLEVPTLRLVAPHLAEQNREEKARTCNLQAW